MNILNKPWFLAILALFMMLGTQLVAVKLYWDELFSAKRLKATVVVRDEPEAFSWGFAAEEISELRQELTSRLAELKAREEALNAYAARLESDRAEIDAIKQSVELIRKELMVGIIQLETGEQKNLKSLAKTYATLTPEAAVNIFRQLDDPTVVKILYFMKSDTVGAILEEMATTEENAAEQVKRAAKLSDMLRLFTDATDNQLQPNI